MSTGAKMNGSGSGSGAESRASFFRQGGWMVIATVGSGVFMTAVQTIAAKMSKGEYGEFNAMLRCLMLLGIPTGAMQTLLAQQTAAALTDERRGQLSRVVRGVFSATFILWLAVAVVVALQLDWVIGNLQVANPNAIRFALMAVLTQLWLPLVKGMLQGRQHFLGMGFVAIFDGVGRFVAVLLAVVMLHAGVTGAMTGVFLGQLTSLALGLWLTREIWKKRGAPFDWAPWLKVVVPLTLGTGALLVLQTADVIFAQSVFPKEIAEFYVPASIVGFALVQFTIPLAVVMYPKVVRSTVASESTDALKLTFLSTAVLGVLAAVASTVLPKLPLEILFATRKEFLEVWPLVPWFAWCMLLFTLANVLVNNLLAREKFAIVPWLVGLAAAYLCALGQLKGSLAAMEQFAAFKAIVKTLIGFNAVTMSLAVWFTWGAGSRSRSSPKI